MFSKQPKPLFNWKDFNDTEKFLLLSILLLWVRARRHLAVASPSFFPGVAGHSPNSHFQEVRSARTSLR